MAKSRKRKKKGKSGGKPQQFMSPEKYIKTKGRGLGIGTCYVTEGWRSHGMAQVIVPRIHPQGQLTVGLYLVDLYAAGVKDTFHRFRISQDELQETILDGYDFEKISYDLAHNIIFGAIEFAEEYEFKPHKDFDKLYKYLLQDKDDPDVEFIDVEFGKNGEPFVVYRDDNSQDWIMQHLDRVVGPDGYDKVYIGDLADEYDEEYDGGEERLSIEEDVTDIVDALYDEKIGDFEKEYHIDELLPNDLKIVENTNEFEDINPSDIFEDNELESLEADKVIEVITKKIEEHKFPLLYPLLAKIKLDSDDNEGARSVLKEGITAYPENNTLRLMYLDHILSLVGLEALEKQDLPYNLESFLNGKEIEERYMIFYLRYLVQKHAEAGEVQQATTMYTELLELDLSRELSIVAGIQIREAQQKALEEKGFMPEKGWEDYINDMLEQLYKEDDED